MLKHISAVLFFLCTCIFAQAQGKPVSFEKLWEQVTFSMDGGLTKTALEQTEAIYALAKKGNNEVQIIKSLLYKCNLQKNITENSNENTLQTLEAEIANEKKPVTIAILKNILATSYKNYFNANRWKLYNRTNTSIDFQKEDVATWTGDDWHKRISTLYMESVENELLLKKTLLSNYDPIIDKGNTRYLRPTLFDLLSHEALQYFANDERNITRPAYKFEINMASAFDPASDFIHRKFTNKDSLSLQHKGLLLYQKLIAFHLEGLSSDALIDVDLARIAFVNRYAVMENKEELYFNAINHIAHQYGYQPAASQAWYLVASYQLSKGNVLEAKSICDKVLKQDAKSEGAVNCYNLLLQIEKKQLNATTEKVNIPEQPFRALITWKNVNQLHLRIVKLNDAQKNRFKERYKNEQQWESLTQLTPVRSWGQALPDKKDHTEHSAEIKIDALPTGVYALIASADENFAQNENVMTACLFYVSNIAHVTNNKNEIFVLHRETGRPLENATIHVWEEFYNTSTRENDFRKNTVCHTDKNGFAKWENNNENKNNNFQFKIEYGREYLFIDENIYTYNYDNNVENISGSRHEIKNAQLFLFTDRAIYRPGQTVYFKGITVTKDFNTKQPKVIEGQKLTVELHDANYKIVDTIILTTNEYGSCSGSFILPSGMLNGNFSIVSTTIRGHIYFSVEEYKRPKFFVEYQKIKGSYRVNDTISVTSVANAFAGNVIDGAMVKYRVVRVPRFIYPWLCRIWGYPSSKPIEIAHGELQTDATGKFEIKFKAIPDLSINRKIDPVFDYKIVADVTDINGETHSATKIVSVSYKALQMIINAPSNEELLIDSLKSMVITTRNMNNEEEPAKVYVQMYRLQHPDRLIRQRYWNQPDTFVMSKEEYIRAFPYDEYKDETKKETWAKIEKIWDITDSSNRQMIIDRSKIIPGWYVIEASTKDKYGEEVKDIQYVLLSESDSKKIPVPQYFNITSSNHTEPGSAAFVNIGSSAKELFIVQQTWRNVNDKKIDTYNYFTINKERKSINLPISESDRGGIVTNFFFIKNNRSYTKQVYINVPWTNKNLNITYETYRNKLLPGSEEKWSLKISGYKKEIVTAELLASMYDASLDQFQLHRWNIPPVWQYFYLNSSWTHIGFSCAYNYQNIWQNEQMKSSYKKYDNLQKIIAGGEMLDVVVMGYSKASSLRGIDLQPVPAESITALLQGKVAGLNIDSEGSPGSTGTVHLRGSSVPATANAEISNDEKVKSSSTDHEAVHTRKNFNETAFFFPQLNTDKEGNISFSFTMPEALTKWKFQALAHTKDLAFGYSTTDVITQKQLMVQPNIPRFVRQGDKIDLSAKIANLGENELTGELQLELFSASNMQPVDILFNLTNAKKSFVVKPKQSTALSFKINIPYGFNDALVYRFVTRATSPLGERVSDGEEAAIPVLTNRMLVTESMPLNLRNTNSKQFKFDKLINSNKSNTLQHYSLTAEYTANPAWYAVQALPYLTEYPYECSEQTFNRYYANALAGMIANKIPRLKKIVQQWNTTDTTALLSNLQKNEELKSVLLEETPWVLDAKNETQQKKNIILLFDMVRMNNALQSTLNKLMPMQLSNGGFTWFTGGRDNRYITQYIITGLGHLNKLGALTKNESKNWNSITDKALQYLDDRLLDEYNGLKKWKYDLDANNLSYMATQYLYMRSFFPEKKINTNAKIAVDYFTGQAKKYWLSTNNYSKGMIALALHRMDEKAIAGAIIKSLEENAIVNEEMGMYWKDLKSGYYWYEAPIETQSLLIETFSEITNNTKIVNDLKWWLLKNKQTNNWKTTKATAEACYALLQQGDDWLTETPDIQINLGGTIINSNEEKTQAGTGYFKKSIEGKNVKSEMGNISLTIPASQSGQSMGGGPGAVYWQYFEQLDKITSAATPLQLNKKLFIESNTDNGLLLSPINENTIVKVGDKIKVRVELRVDRDMEYVHMKDMRASAMEPVNVLSSYKWQGGLGYYESTKDASTNFFFDYLRKGTYVFEYPLFVTHTGNFSTGVTTIQCMYAPEFTSHSEGMRIEVGN